MPQRPKSKKTSSRRFSPPTGDGLDQAKVERVYSFFETVLKHSKGGQAGQPFLLLPWQKYVLGEIFGRCKPDGTRQYRQAYVEIPKKNGKSTLLAGISLYVLLADGEMGAEIYGAASDREQAGIIYREAASMVRSSPALSKVLEVVADDPMVFLDLPAWCHDAGHEVLSMEQQRDVITTLIRVA